MTVAEYLDHFDVGQICTVNGHPVWDYKDVDSFREVRLISEPVEGSENYSKVIKAELSNFVGIWAKTAIVVDEETGKEVESI